MVKDSRDLKESQVQDKIKIRYHEYLPDFHLLVLVHERATTTTVQSQLLLEARRSLHIGLLGNLEFHPWIFQALVRVTLSNVNSLILVARLNYYLTLFQPPPAPPATGAPSYSGSFVSFASSCGSCGLKGMHSSARWMIFKLSFSIPCMISYMDYLHIYIYILYIYMILYIIYIYIQQNMEFIWFCFIETSGTRENPGGWVSPPANQSGIPGPSCESK